MVNFIINMDLYFWLVERAELSDDPKNEMVEDEGRVSLHRDQSNKLLNGLTVAKLMLCMR